MAGLYLSKIWFVIKESLETPEDEIDRKVISAIASEMKGNGEYWPDGAPYPDSLNDHQMDCVSSGIWTVSREHPPLLHDYGVIDWWKNVVSKAQKGG